MGRWLAAIIFFFVASALPGPGQIDVELETGKVNSSARCGACHNQIYTMWRRSMHSASLSDPIFEASYLRAYLETGGEAAAVCLPCHAPAAVLTGDYGLTEAVSREGITCDFCHSVVAVDLESKNERFKVKLDGVKRGPLSSSKSPAHLVAESSLHEASEFCAGCHEYTNEHGQAVFSTYTEWKASPQAAEGKTCQHCHMPVTAGTTVRAGVSDIRRREINLHNISGMHSVEQVRRGATAEIVSIKRQRPTSVVVEVEVENSGSGHSIPTGLPTRKLVLEVVVYADDRELRRFQREYQKVLLDERGIPIREDHRTILAARSLRQDNRLLAGERRRERFVASVPPDAKVRAEMHLRYVYNPKILTDQAISIEMASDSSPIIR